MRKCAIEPEVRGEDRQEKRSRNDVEPSDRGCSVERELSKYLALLPIQPPAALDLEVRACHRKYSFNSDNASSTVRPQGLLRHIQVYLSRAS